MKSGKYNDMLSRFLTPAAYPKKAFESNGIEFWGSSQKTLSNFEFKDSDLIISCNSQSLFQNYFVISSPQNFGTDIKKTRYEQIILKWDDYSEPPEAIGLKFWKDIINYAVRNNKKRILCCCSGGLGRTGTALSCLLLASGLEVYPDEAISYIKVFYNKFAVETQGQAEYIFNLILTSE